MALVVKKNIDKKVADILGVEDKKKPEINDEKKVTVSIKSANKLNYKFFVDVDANNKGAESVSQVDVCFCKGDCHVAAECKWDQLVVKASGKLPVEGVKVSFEEKLKGKTFAKLALGATYELDKIAASADVDLAAGVGNQEKEFGVGLAYTDASLFAAGVSASVLGDKFTPTINAKVGYYGLDKATLVAAVLKDTDGIEASGAVAYQVNAETALAAKVSYLKDVKVKAGVSRKLDDSTSVTLRVESTPDKKAKGLLTATHQVSKTTKVTFKAGCPLAGECCGTPAIGFTLDLEA